jgi:hypothetical protein
LNAAASYSNEREWPEEGSWFRESMLDFGIAESASKSFFQCLQAIDLFIISALYSAQPKDTIER